MALDDHNARVLYPEHLTVITQRFDKALELAGFDAVAIGAGTDVFRFLDDQTYPFVPNPHFSQWMPITTNPESCIVYTPGQRPQLVLHRPDDYWHRSPPVPDVPWSKPFDVQAIAGPDDLVAILRGLPGRTAHIGAPAQWRHSPPADDQNPRTLLDYLHYYRPYKTSFERECIRLATARAVPAHYAAERAFRDGGAEYDILMAFLRACGQTELELPYGAIIATNANGAILHYQHYERTAATPRSLLIDAACSAYGYASDITRTYSFDSQVEFAQMVADMDTVQQELCGKVAPGVPFVELHEAAHLAIAGLLRDWGLVERGPAEIVATGTSATFFPHGLGHFLGIQVHEVGGFLADPNGAEIPQPEKYPHLRLLRTLEADQVLTIEPGIYFIDSLLDKLKSEPIAKHVNWTRIEELKKFGGIRIEDNLAVTSDGAENITRLVFSCAPL